MKGTAPIRNRLDQLARLWRVSVEHTLATHTALVAFGRRGLEPVVLKVFAQHGDESRSGEILAAFDGPIVRVLDYVGGAVLLERLSPADSLANVALSGRDDEATRIVADLIAQLSPGRLPTWCPTVRDWGKSFARCEAAARRVVPAQLLEHAQSLYDELCRTQVRPRLLHGDLHHYNILSDSRRGWVAIDPKGVVGEIEYEVGAALRNPNDRPALFANARVVERRVGLFAQRLNIDVQRVLQWAFAQAVLSVVWGVEDGCAVDGQDPSLQLAAEIRPMLDAGAAGPTAPSVRSSPP